MVIEIRNLVVTYRWRHEPVLKSISAVLESNGSGKTTPFRAACGLTRNPFLR